MSERTTPLVKLNGVAIGRGRTFDFREGSNVTLSVTETDSEVDVTIAASGVGGGGVAVEEAGTPLGTADTINFGTGLDVNFAGGLAEVTVDTAELTVITAIAAAGNVVG